MNRAGGAIRLQMAGKTIDGIQFGNQIVDRSIGRVAGQWVLTNASPGAANSAAPVAAVTGNVALNEWLASSADGGPDWLELYNKNASLPVALSVRNRDSLLFSPRSALMFQSRPNCKP